MWINLSTTRKHDKQWKARKALLIRPKRLSYLFFFLRLISWWCLTYLYLLCLEREQEKGKSEMLFFRKCQDMPSLCFMNVFRKSHQINKTKNCIAPLILSLPFNYRRKNIHLDVGMLSWWLSVFSLSSLQITANDLGSFGGHSGLLMLQLKLSLLIVLRFVSTTSDSNDSDISDELSSASCALILDKLQLTRFSTVNWLL